MTPAALIVIDIQKGFADPAWGRRNNPDFEAHVGRLLAAWRAASRPVVHVRHDSRQPASPLRPGQWGNDFMPCAAPLAGEPVVAKAVNSAFIGTGLEARLREAGVTDLVFAGLTTDHCVSTSVRMAANLGFAVTVAADATATYDRWDDAGERIPAELVHRVSLASLRDEFAAVVPTDRLITLGDFSR